MAHGKGGSNGQMGGWVTSSRCRKTEFVNCAFHASGPCTVHMKNVRVLKTEGASRDLTEE